MSGLLLEQDRVRHRYTGGALVFDVEIEKAILMEGELHDPEIEYCKGWDDVKNMGIASVCTLNTKTGEARVFMKDNLLALYGYMRHHVELDHGVLCSYNGIKFDGPLLECNGIQMPTDHHYDLLRHIWAAAGRDPNLFDRTTHMGYGLNDMCLANGIGRKSGNGAHAPRLFQRGQYGQLIDYNMRDCWLTAKLLSKALESIDHMLYTPRSQVINLECPEIPSIFMGSPCL